MLCCERAELVFFVIIAIAFFINIHTNCYAIIKRKCMEKNGKTKRAEKWKLTARKKVCAMLCVHTTQCNKCDWWEFISIGYFSYDNKL